MKDETMDHGRIEEIVAAYALGSLERGDEAERELLEHIPGCASCRALFRDLREVTADIALAAPARPVPRELEPRLLARIRGEAQPGVRAPIARPPSIRMAAVAAAVVLVFAGGLGAWNVSLSSRVMRAERRVAQAAEALAVVGHPGVRITPLSGSGGGSLVLAYRPDGGAVLVGTGIADPGRGRILELWLIRNETPVPVDVFLPSAGSVLLSVSLNPAEYETVAVTVESRRVDAPTSNPVYSAKL